MAEVYVRGFDFGTSESDIQKYFQKAGPVNGVEMFGKGAAVVTYATANNAETAIAQLHESTMPGHSRYIEVKLNDKQAGKKRSLESIDGPSCRVFVRGFDFGTTDEQFEGHMSQVGTIERVQWCTKGSAIVIYSSPDEAAAAVANLNETTIEGNSRFIDVILKDATEQGPPAKRAKGGKGFAKGSGFGSGQGVWVFHPTPAAALLGLGGFGKGGFGKGGFGKAGNSGKGKRRSDPPGAGRVFVRGFDFGTTDEQLLGHMKRAGDIIDVHWVTKGSAVVIYKNAASAQKAANVLNNTTIKGNSRFIDVLLKDNE